MKKKNKLLLSLLTGLGLMSISPLLKIYNQRQRQIRNHQRKIKNQHRKEEKEHKNEKKHNEFKDSLVALNSFANSVESSVVANAKAFSSASASTSTAMSYSAQQEASQVASASMQQSLIDSEDADIAQQLSQSTSTSALASINSSSTTSLAENTSVSPAFAKEVRHDLSHHYENDPLAKSNNWDFKDFGNLYRNEKQKVENYLQSKLPQGSLVNLKNEYANGKNNLSYDYALDTLYSLAVSNDTNYSSNYFNAVNRPLTRLGSLYEHKSNLANHYIMNQLSGSNLAQFESLSNATSVNQKNGKHDEMIDSYLNSLEDSKAQSIVNQISSSSASDAINYSPNYFYKRGLDIVKDGLKKNQIKPNASGYQGIINALNRSRSDDDGVVASSDNNQFLSSLSSLAESNYQIPISSFSSTFNSKMNSASTSYQELLKSYYLSEQKMLNSLKSSSTSSNSK